MLIFLVNFAPMDRHLGGRHQTKLDAIAANFQHDDFDVLANPDGLVRLASKYEHGENLLD